MASAVHFKPKEIRNAPIPGYFGFKFEEILIRNTSRLSWRHHQQENEKPAILNSSGFDKLRYLFVTD